jgi:hypothetical protein
MAKDRDGSEGRHATTLDEVLALRSDNAQLLNLNVALREEIERLRVEIAELKKRKN